MAITSIISAIVLFESIFHTGQCEDVLFCGAKQESVLGAVNGRNVFVQFFLEDPLTENQSIVWAKWIEEKNQLLDDVDNATARNRNRYKLTNVAGERMINLSIAFSEPSDSGEYVLKIHHKDQKLCTIASFNLTIESTEPVCSTLYDQKTQRLQMSCEWMQVNIGDQVQLLDGDQVLYEYGTKDMNIDGVFNSTNIVSIYSSIEDIHNGRVMPSVCLISNKDKSNNNCSFPFVQDLRLHSIFECCPKEQTDADVLWYTNGSMLIPLSPNNTVSFVHDGRLSLFCGVRTGSKTILLRNISFVNLEKKSKVSLSAVDENGKFNFSEGNSSGANINVACLNVSNEKEPEEVESNTERNSTKSNVVDVSSEPKYEPKKIPTWVWVTLSLLIICCIITGFVNFFYSVLRKYFPYLRKTTRKSLPTAPTEAIVDTQHSDISGGMMSLDLLSTQHRSPNIRIRGAVTSEAIRDHGNLQQSQDVKVFGSFRTDETLVHKQKEPESHCFGHLPSNSTSNDGDLSGAMGFTKPDSEANPDSPDSVYCSVDDVKGAPGDVNMDQLNSHATSIQHPSPSPKDQPHVQTSFSSSVKPGKIPRNSSTARLKKASKTDADVDLLYSKPDMSRKTNRITALESGYDDPRPPKLDLGLTPRCKLNEKPNILEHDKDCGMSLTDLYENNIANPTDELVDNYELYVNY